MNNNKKIGTCMIFLVLVLLLIPSLAMALSKPIAGFVFMNDNVTAAENATVIVYVNQSTLPSANPCYTNPSVLSGSDGSFSTNLANLKRSDNHADCSGFWSTGEPIWAEADGTTVVPEQGNGSISGDTISAGTGLQYLSNVTLDEGPDITDPTVTILSPVNTTNSTTGNVVFVYNVTDNDGISNCSLILNNVVNETDDSITMDTNQSFSKTLMGDGDYNWSVNCTDNSGNMNNSEMWEFNVSKIGHLEVTLITPDSDTNVEQFEFFEFTSQVSCVGGSCGHVWAYLDPIDSSLDSSINSISSTSLDGISLDRTFPRSLSNTGSEDSSFLSKVLTFFKNLLTGNLITGMATGSLVPTTPSEPFWTNSSNPANSSDFACLSDMRIGESCNTTWYVNASGNASIISEFYVIYNTTNFGGMENESAHINITIVDTRNPDVVSVTATPSTINQTETTNITATITDYNTISKVFVNITYPNSTIETYEMSNVSDVWYYEFTPEINYPTSIYNVVLIANDSYNNINDSETTSFTVNDVSAPAWSNNMSLPVSGAAYNDTHQFNITWTDNIGVETVLIEHDFSGTLTNYSVSGNSGSVYYYNHGAIATGNYVWKSYANDSSGNLNVSDEFSYVVVQADPSNQIHLALDGSQSNNTYTYGENVVATTWKDISEGSLNLYRNGSLLSSGQTPGDTSNLTVGLYNHTVEYPETQNYTFASVTYFATINRVTPSLTLQLSPDSTVFVGTATNVTCYANNDQSNVTLWRNGTLVDSSVGGTVSDYQTLAIGSYPYVCNVSQTQNYTNATTTQTLTVTDKEVSVCSLSFNPESPINYETYTNVSCSCTNNETSAKLYRDNVDVSGEINTDVLLGADTYAYVCNVTETASWSTATNSSSFTVNKLNSLSKINLSLDGTEGNRTYTYPATINASAWKSISEGNLSLYRNGTLLKDGQAPENVSNVAAGYWNYTVIYPESANYTSSRITYFATMNRATTNLNLTFNPSNSVYASTTTNVSCNADNSIVNVTLWRNGTLVDSSVGGTASDYQTLAAGSYPYICNNSVTANYTAANDSDTLTVTSKNISSCSLDFNPTSPTTYGTNLNVSCSCTNAESDAELYRNETNVTDEIGVDVVLGAANYDYTCNVTETDAWTSATNSSNYTVNQAATVVNLTINDSNDNYTNTINFSTNIQCNIVTPTTGNLELRQNGDLIDNGPSPLGNNTEYYTSEGEYLINCSYAGNENYSAGFDAYYINATWTDIFSVTLNSPDAGYSNTSASPAEINFNCSASEPTYNLTNVSLYLTDDGNNNFAINQSTNLSGSSDSAAWDLNLTNGNYTWSCLSFNSNEDSVWASPNRTITVNYQAAVFAVELNDPSDSYSNTTDSPAEVDFNCSVSDPTYNLTNVSLYLTNASNSSFVVNQTTNLTGMNSSAQWPVNLTSGNYTWNCLAFNANNDSVWASANRSATVNYQEDVTNFSVTLNSPANGSTDSSANPANVVFNCSVTNPTYNSTNVSLYLTGSDNLNFSLNKTTNLTNLNETANWTVSLRNGDYTWNCLTFNDNNDSVWGSSNYSLTVNYQAPSGSSSSSSSSSGGGGGGGGGGGRSYDCNDNKDNDGDGLKDYPNDPGCTSYSDNDETDKVNEEVTVTLPTPDNDDEEESEIVQSVNQTIIYNETEHIYIINQTKLFDESEEALLRMVSGAANIFDGIKRVLGIMWGWKWKVLMILSGIAVLIVGFLLPHPKKKRILLDKKELFRIPGGLIESVRYLRTLGRNRKVEEQILIYELIVEKNVAGKIRIKDDFLVFGQDIHETEYDFSKKMRGKKF